VLPILAPLYDYAWFVGFLASGLAHLALARVPARVERPAVHP
jgi:cytosine/uracil/thiamine/allantoin permease